MTENFDYIFDCLCDYTYYDQRDDQKLCEQYKPYSDEDTECIYFYESESSGIYCCQSKHKTYVVIAKLYLEVSEDKEFQKILTKLL